MPEFDDFEVGDLVAWTYDVIIDNKPFKEYGIVVDIDCGWTKDSSCLAIQPANGGVPVFYYADNFVHIEIIRDRLQIVAKGRPSKTFKNGAKNELG